MDRSTSRQTGHVINNSTFEDDSEIDKVVSHWTGHALYMKKHVQSKNNQFKGRKHQFVNVI